MPCSTDPVKLPKKGYPLRPCPSAAILAVSTPDKFRTAYVPGKPVRRCFEKGTSSIPGVISGFTDNDYLTVDFSGLDIGGNFTIECFAFLHTGDDGPAFTTSDGVEIWINDTYIFSNSYQDHPLAGDAYVDKWVHYAIVNSGGTVTAYVNGISVNTYTITTISGPLYIGSFEGRTLETSKIANLRVSNIARYSTNFTPSLPLIADVNTTLLITDSLSNSVGGATVTVVGNPTVTPEVIQYAP